MSRLLPALAVFTCLAPAALAQEELSRVRVTFENTAPTNGNFFTPVWVGFHDGTFDIYNQGLPANGPTALIPNDALEALAEDGNNGPISVEFLASGTGTVDATLPGPNGPIAPGDLAGGSFLLNRFAPSSKYFSYASMVLPSNDTFVANGNPLAIPIFDGQGEFIAPRFYDLGIDFLDAGTEVNDEIPANTAFFGQAVPNTGVDENGVVLLSSGLNLAGSGGILDDPRFAEATFTDIGYPGTKIRFSEAPARTDVELSFGILSGAQEVPAVATPATGIAAFVLTDDGTSISYFISTSNLNNVIGLHLHLGGVGENGPIVVNLIDPEVNLDANPFPLAPGGGKFGLLTGSFDVDALAGPLAAQPLDTLSALLDEGGLYVNIHTSDGVEGSAPGPGNFMAGELRAQINGF